MSHKGNTKITFIFTADGDHVAEGDRLFKSHESWMEKSHHTDGTLALLQYDVAKGPEVSNSLDPSSAPTGRTCFAMTEVYASPEGLADHWKQGAESWPEFNEFLAWASAVDVCVLHGSPVIHSLW